MSFLFSLFLFLFCNNESTSLRIIQYNAEWLFLNYYEPMDCPGAGCSWKNTTHAYDHLNRFASRLGPLDGDIINVCEVQGVFELDKTIQSMNVFKLNKTENPKNPNNTKTKYQSFFVPGTDTSTNQNVGLISKYKPLTQTRTNNTAIYPVDNSTCGYTGDRMTDVSKHYITSFSFKDNFGDDIDGANKNKTKTNKTLTIIAAHLIAIPDDIERCAKREAQATILQQIVFDATSVGHEVILMGDLNDYDGSTLDINSNIPLSSTLDILKGAAGKYKDAYSLVNLANYVLPENRYSDWWDSKGDCGLSANDYSMIDHVLVTPNIEKSLIRIAVDHGYDEFCDKLDSDHYPVIVDLDIDIV